MIRPEEAKVLEGMKQAKTAAEMVSSWSAQRGNPNPTAKSQRPFMDLYARRKPEMISSFAHNQIMQVVERGILDPKTRYLVILGCYMMIEHWHGLLPQSCNAKAAGATEEEIMEVAFLACYCAGKSKNVNTCDALSEVFESPLFKSVTPMKEGEQVTA